jgi:hypothetical protein
MMLHYKGNELCSVGQFPTSVTHIMAIASAPVTANGGHHSTMSLTQQLSKDHDLVLRAFRMPIADLCQQFGGGSSWVRFASRQT